MQKSLSLGAPIVWVNEVTSWSIQRIGTLPVHFTCHWSLAPLSSIAMRKTCVWLAVDHRRSFHTLIWKKRTSWSSDNVSDTRCVAKVFSPSLLRMSILSIGGYQRLPNSATIAAERVPRATATLTAKFNQKCEGHDMRRILARVRWYLSRDPSRGGFPCRGGVRTINDFVDEGESSKRRRA